MAKTWILDTETKGTGAHMVPLEEALRKPSLERDLALVTFERPPRDSEPANQPAPLKFKVLDVRSSQVLGEGLSARETVDLLGRVRSVVDVRMYVWLHEAERWRMLTLGEQKTLWALRGKAPAATSSSPQA